MGIIAMHAALIVLHTEHVKKGYTKFATGRDCLRATVVRIHVASVT